MKTVECSKCGDSKLRSEFYRGKRNTCKECHKADQKKRWMKKKEEKEYYKLIQMKGRRERREAKKKTEWDKLREFILDNYNKANVKVDGILVVSEGEFVGERGRIMFCEAMLNHRAWMKRNHLSEPDMVPTDER